MIVAERVVVGESVVYTISNCQVCGPKSVRYNQNCLQRKIVSIRRGGGRACRPSSARPSLVHDQLGHGRGATRPHFLAEAGRAISAWPS